MAIFEGAGVALVTPFHEDGTVNYEKLEEIIEEQIAGGTDSIIICGTTGESSTMTHEEHLDVIRYCCKVVNKRIPVVAGTGSNCTREAIDMSKGAESVGADAVKIPVILYHVPSRTGVTMTPETMAALFHQVDNIVGVKEASGNFSAIAKLMKLTDGKMDIYSGNDDQIVPILALGGKGVISVLSNVAPAQTHEICASYFAGDVAKSARMQIDAIPLVEALFSEVNPIPVKAAMNLMGKEVGPLRLPLTEIEPAHREKLAQTMREYGILK